MNVISTKYSLKEKVFLMKNNQVCIGIIRAINCSTWINDNSKIENIVIRYELKEDSRPFSESVLFSSKEELLNSI